MDVINSVLPEHSFVFISDLDRTLIHSQNPEYPVVEWLMKEKEKPRPVTHMTLKSVEQLATLLADPDFQFIPCTMRNYEQVMRVGWLSYYQPALMICTNGAQIYVQGQLDLEWEQRMRRYVTQEELDQEQAMIEQLPIPSVEIRQTEGFYLTLKFKTEEAAMEAFRVIQPVFQETNRQVLQIGRKVFVMHKAFDKVHAVDYLLQDRTDVTLYTAGDTEVDRQFTLRGQALLPKHATFRHAKAWVSETLGIEATDELLEKVVAEFNVFKKCL